jgi:branched-chain amino acid transport system permease protein
VNIQYWADAANVILIYSVFAFSMNVLLGYAGQPSVAPAAFGAVGGYAAAYLTISHGVSPIAAIGVGAVAGGVIGVVVGGPALRLSTEYIILLTVAFGEIVLGVANNSSALGGTEGLIGLPYLTIGSWRMIQPTQFLLFFLAVSIAVFFFTRRIGESAYGVALRAVREDESVVSSSGLNPFTLKLGAFIASSALAGLGGGELVFYDRVATPGQFGFSQSILIVAMVLIGGLGSPLGPIAGAVIVEILPVILQHIGALSPGTASNLQGVVFGLLLILVIVLKPSGLFPERPLRFVRVFARRESVNAQTSAAENHPDVLSDVTDDVQVSPPSISTSKDEDIPIVLRVEGARRRFGGIVAADGIDFSITKGEITGLIGPNGAGKTTVFNLITGAVRLDEGRVWLNGESIENKGSHEIARLGMVRSFQDGRIIGQISVLENVLLGAIGRERLSLVSTFVRPRRTARRTQLALKHAYECLQWVGLSDEPLRLGSEVSFGEQKLISLARVLSSGATVLLLDEPVSGVGHDTAQKILEVIRSARDDGRTILLVEHNLLVLREIAESALFMEEGRVRTRGRYEQLIQDPELAAIYFGTGWNEDSSDGSGLRSEIGTGTQNLDSSGTEV